MRMETFLAAAAVTVASCGLGSAAASAQPSDQASCVAQYIAAAGAPGGAPGQNGPMGGRAVSALAQADHNECLPNNLPV